MSGLGFGGVRTSFQCFNEKFGFHKTPEISWLHEDLPGSQGAVCSARYGLMASKKTQTAIVKLEVIVAMIIQSTTSHHIPHYSCRPINNSNLVTHSQKRNALSIPSKPSSGLRECTSKTLRCKKNALTYAKARTL